MHNEVELKAVMSDPGSARMRLLSVGAVLRFRGAMSDRRYDRNGELAARDEVLRVRTFRDADGRSSAVIGWKGPTRRSAEGYKEREEIELAVGEARGAPAALLAALGYEAVYDIDRWVEVFELGGAVVRLESYPRMDDLVEVEGDPPAIERAVTVLGIPRAEFTAEPLTEFVRRYELRAGAPAVLASSGAAHAPAWAAP
jgi:adenylate cyclase class IV